MDWLNPSNNGLSTSGSVALLIGLVVFIGSAAFHARKVVGRSDSKWHASMATLVPMLISTTYLSILLGTGVIELDNGRIFHVARWIDACFGTPLIILSILLLLGPLTGRLLRIVMLLLALDVLTMLGGLLAGLQTEPMIAWIWYGYGSLAYLGVVLLLLFTVPQFAQQTAGSSTRLRAYRRYAAIFVGLSLAFPVVWFFTPAALGQLSLDGEVMAFLPFDLATKVGLMFAVTQAGERL